MNLPPQERKQLPPVQRPVPPPVPVKPEKIEPEKKLAPAEVPKPTKFGTGSEVALPQTGQRPGVPEGADQGAATGKKGTAAHPPPGPLPFLSQQDIDALARKGMPAQKPGDDSVTLDTDEFKYLSYNKWLKIRVESVLHYPELAALSGYQGTLYIKFDILKDGSLGAVDVLKSSGYKILDDEAVRAITESAPFQPLPDSWGMERYSIRAAVVFYLGVGYIR